jgi:hypothetical protein
MPDIVASRVIGGIAGLIESYGHNATSLAERIGLDPEALYRPDIMISELMVNDLFEEAAAVCKDRYFSLKVAQIQGWDILGPIGELIQSARTVG